MKNPDVPPTRYWHQLRFDSSLVRSHEVQLMYARSRHDCAIGGISKAAQRGDIGCDLAAERKDLEYLVRLHVLNSALIRQILAEASARFVVNAQSSRFAAWGRVRDLGVRDIRTQLRRRTAAGTAPRMAMGFSLEIIARAG
jgi:hypothetical protein